MMYSTNLRILKKELGLTTEQMAKTLRIPARTLGGYERGERTPSIDFATQLCNTFGVNINWFLTGKGEIFKKDSKKDIDCFNLMKKNYNFTTEQMGYIQEFLEGGIITREVFFTFMKANKGDKESLEYLLQTTQRLKKYLK